MYNSRMLFNDAQRFGAAKSESDKVWKAFGAYVDECLRLGKGLKVPKFGSFTSLKNSTRDPTPGIKRRIFHVASPFARAYGIPQKKVGHALVAPSLEFNFSKLAYKCGLDKDTAQVTLNLLLRTLGQAIASGQPCRILLDPVGTLLVQRREITFKFTGYPDNMPFPEPPLWGVTNATSAPSLAAAAGGDLSYLMGESGAVTGGGGGDALDAELASSAGGVAPETTEGEAVDAAAAAAAAAAAEAEAEAEAAAAAAAETNVMQTMMASASMPDLATTNNTSMADALDSLSGMGTPGYQDYSDHSERATRQELLEERNKKVAMYHGAPPSRNKPTGKKRHPETISVFPKFSATEVENAAKSRMNMSTINANLANAFSRLEGRLKEEQDNAARQEEEIRQRQLLTQQLFLERKTVELNKQKELNRFLTQQKEEAELRRADAKRRNKLLFSEDAGRAHPVEQMLDLDEELRLKRTLKHALDEQVMIKTRMDAEAHEMEREREKFLLECLMREGAADAQAKLTKKTNDRKELQGDWDKQHIMAVASNKLMGKIL